MTRMLLGAAVLCALTLPVQAKEKTPMPNRTFASAADLILTHSETP